jgi:hypothetical protein
MNVHNARNGTCWGDLDETTVVDREAVAGSAILF